jgi:hypothetical protein
VAIGAGLVRFQGKSGPPVNLYVGPLDGQSDCGLDLRLVDPAHDHQLGSAGAQLGSPLYPGGLNRSPQHFILEGKDGVWDGTEIS